MEINPKLKRLMILGASELQLPAILKAKEMGLYVGVVDYNPNAIGVPLADEYFNVSTVDEEGVLQAATSFGADGILTLATDMPMRAVAYACEKLGLLGISYEAAIKATDKAEMMHAISSNQVGHPWFIILEDVDDLKDAKDKITYPCVCKPIDSAGSRGVSLVLDESEIESAVYYSAGQGTSGKIIIEEYLEGIEVSVEVIAYAGEILVTVVTDKFTTGAPNFVEMGHCQPSRLSCDKISEILKLTQNSVQALGIDYGAAHVEIMYTNQGPKLIELGARLGGDFIASHLVPLSTGIDMVKAAIDIACGKQPEILQKYSKGSAIKYFDYPSGVIAAVFGLDEAARIPGVISVSMCKNVGEAICKVRSSAERLGFVIAQGNTAADALNICENAIETIDIRYANEVELP